MASGEGREVERSLSVLGCGTKQKTKATHKMDGPCTHGRIWVSVPWVYQAARRVAVQVVVRHVLFLRAVLAFQLKLRLNFLAAFLVVALRAVLLRVAFFLVVLRRVVFLRAVLRAVALRKALVVVRRALRAVVLFLVAVRFAVRRLLVRVDLRAEDFVVLRFLVGISMAPMASELAVQRTGVCLSQRTWRHHDTTRGERRIPVPAHADGIDGIDVTLQREPRIPARIAGSGRGS